LISFFFFLLFLDRRSFDPLSFLIRFEHGRGDHFIVFLRLISAVMNPFPVDI
jgi:hypothetical protein